MTGEVTIGSNGHPGSPEDQFQILQEDRGPVRLLFVSQSVKRRGRGRRGPAVTLEGLREGLLPRGRLTWDRLSLEHVLGIRLWEPGISDRTGGNERRGDRAHERYMVASPQSKPAQTTAKFVLERATGAAPLYRFESFCYAKNFLCASWRFILQRMGEWSHGSLKAHKPKSPPQFRHCTDG